MEAIAEVAACLRGFHGRSGSHSRWGAAQSLDASFTLSLFCPLLETVNADGRPSFLLDDFCLLVALMKCPDSNAELTSIHKVDRAPMAARGMS